MPNKKNRNRPTKKIEKLADNVNKPQSDVMRDIPTRKYRTNQLNETFNTYRSETVTINDMKKADANMNILEPTEEAVKQIFDGLRVGTTCGVDSIYDPAFADVYRKLILVTKPIPDYLLCSGLQSYIPRIAKLTNILKPIDNVSSLTESSSEAVYRCIARSLESVMHSKNNHTHAWHAFKRQILPPMIILKQSWATGMTIADMENHLTNGNGPIIALINFQDEVQIEELILRRGTSSGIYILKKQKDHWKTQSIKALQFYVNIIHPDNVTKIIDTGFISTISQRCQTVPTFVKEHVVKIVYPVNIANKIAPYTQLTHNYNHYRVISRTLNFLVCTFEELDSTLVNTKIVSDLEKESLLNWMNRGKVISQSGEPTPSAIRRSPQLTVTMSNAPITDTFAISKVTNLRGVVQSRQQLVIFAEKGAGKSSLINILNQNVVTVIDSDDYGNADTYQLEAQLSALLICSSLYDIPPSTLQQALGRLIAGIPVSLNSLVTHMPNIREYKRHSYDKIFAKYVIHGLNPNEYITEIDTISTQLSMLFEGGISRESYIDFITQHSNAVTGPVIIMCHTESETVAVRQVSRSCAVIKMVPGLDIEQSQTMFRKRDYLPFQTGISMLYGNDMFFDSAMQSAIVQALPNDWIL